MIGRACTCACGDSFDRADDLDSHLIEVPEADDRDHYEVTAHGRAPVLARGRVDPRIAWGMRRLRVERGWTLEQVARLLGCDVSRVSRIERGQRGTPSPTVVAELLATTVGYLLMPCPTCNGKPPVGYACLRCGIKGQEEP
jgi:hypothetical protein